MKFRSILACTILVCSTFLPISSFAATKVVRSKVYSVTRAGKKYQCFKVKNKPQFVIKQNGKLMIGPDALKSLLSQLKKKGEDKTTSGKKKYSALKEKVNAGLRACKNPDSTNPGGNPGGNPETPGSASMAALGRALTRADVQYLLDKAALGLSSREEYLVDIGVNDGIEALVDELMKSHTEPSGLLARVTDRLDGHMGSTTTHTPAGQRQALIDLWMNTKNPYQEKFALFMLTVWTTAGDVISDETFRASFWDYYTRLRNYAYSNDAVPDLGLAITRDPLMLIYLNNELNVKGNPNENYARELMELFTLGPTDLDGNPNYTETKVDGTGDIATAAKMLTGWKVNLNYQTNHLDAQYVTARHENGPHTMFPGKSYQFSGENDEDLVRGIFANHPGVKNYYAKEILKLYVTPNPNRALVEAFGAIIAAKGYRLKEAMKVLLMSEAFFDPAYKDTVPMNSFEFSAKTARLLELFNGVNPSYADYQMQKMGLLVNQSPSVFWYNPDSWNSASIILEKANFISGLLGDNTSLNSINWTAAVVLPSGTTTNQQLLDHVQAKLGVRAFSGAQLQTLLGYLTTELQYNGVYLPFVYNNKNAQHQKTKGIGVYYLMFMTPEFNML